MFLFFADPDTPVRSLLAGGQEPASGGLFGDSSASGWHVVTPFRLSDRDLTILVNRGWVPKRLQDPAARLVGQVQGEVELVGVVRKSEVRQPFTPPQGRLPGTARNFFNRDVSAIASELETSPVFIDAESSVPGGPTGGQTKVILRNEHLSYMLTW